MELPLVLAELYKLSVLDRIDRIVIYHLLLKLEDYLLPSELATLFKLFFEAQFGTSFEYYNFLHFLNTNYNALP